VPGGRPFGYAKQLDRAMRNLKPTSRPISKCCPRPPPPPSPSPVATTALVPAERVRRARRGTEGAHRTPQTLPRPNLLLILPTSSTHRRLKVDLPKGTGGLTAHGPSPRLTISRRCRSHGSGRMKLEGGYFSQCVRQGRLHHEEFHTRSLCGLGRATLVPARVLIVALYRVKFLPLAGLSPG
jgi:hypothetical protein